MQQLLLLEELPDEPVSRKIATVGHAGFNQARLLQAVRLLGECSWTSAFTEKQHAAASRMKRQHPDLTDGVLVARSFMHTFRELLAGESALAKRRRPLKAWLLALQRKHPERITGRHVFLAAAMERARAKEERSPEVVVDRKKVMRAHGQRWQQLSLDARAAYGQEAALEKSAKRQRLEAEAEAVHAELGSLQRQAQAQGGDAGSSGHGCFLIDVFLLSCPGLQSGAVDRIKVQVAA